MLSVISSQMLHRLSGIARSTSLATQTAKRRERNAVQRGGQPAGAGFNHFPYASSGYLLYMGFFDHI
ncbi:hypothetical protein DP116_09190 [Brasilonema bromeliae SPC951]|uniref:Uncharacterized protein n=1 Tax=Brasilonema bromeliae SPC951 TaxID=385972 RepID=A0ABX1P5J7_9CYAN|nr:hypothetical protein [Brasilonema bromeliae SPC951]